MKNENKSALIRTGSLNLKCSKNTFPLNSRDEHQQRTAPSEAARLVFLARKSHTWSFRYANGMYRMTYTLRSDWRCFRFAFQLRSSDFSDEGPTLQPCLVWPTTNGLLHSIRSRLASGKCQMVAAVSHAKRMYLTSDGFYGHFRRCRPQV